MPYKHFLGYEKGEDDLPKVIEKEASVVRMIYRMFLEGKTTRGIAKCLTEKNIPTPSGKKTWQTSTVTSILHNEKYKGDAILQKSFTVDFLTKKSKVNEGEVPQYYVENSHPAIISSEIYDLVQQEFSKRKKVNGYKTGGSFFSGKIVCGECGSFYGSKVWHSTSKYRRTIWQCNNKFKNDNKCQTPHLYEDTIKEAFIDAFNSLIDNKEEIIKDYMTIIHKLSDTADLERESAKLQRDSDILYEQMQENVEENAHTTLDQEDYDNRYKVIKKQYENTKNELVKITDKRIERKTKLDNMKAFINILEQSGTIFQSFDEDLWNSSIEKVKVISESEIAFELKDGVEWRVTRLNNT